MPRLNIFTKDEISLFDKPPRFSPEQRQKYFHLSDKLIPLLKNLRSTTNKVCMALQWGYFRASGRFFSIDDFYSSDLRYVAQMLKVPHQEINLVEYREKRKITFEHQHMILETMNFRPLNANTKAWLYTQLESLASKHMQPREMIYYLASQCHQQQIEIPTYHYFVEHITQIYNSVENRLLSVVKNNITPEQKKHACFPIAQRFIKNNFVVRLEILQPIIEGERHPIRYRDIYTNKRNITHHFPSFECTAIIL